ncbi:MAG: hypothetical protein KGZ39_07175 [Simkania sp.]|nr:hypothetical protein [Simkania sp.]
MKIRHITAIRLSGLVWLAVGIMLMMKGVPLLVKATTNGHSPLVKFLIPMVGSADQAAMSLVIFGLLAGLIKGRVVLAKAARKGMQRLVSLSSPLPISQLYPPRYYLLLLIMVGLGVSLRFLGIPADIHGFIDLAVGSALINGGMTYFREGSSVVRGISTNL